MNSKKLMLNISEEIQEFNTFIYSKIAITSLFLKTEL